MEEKIVKPNTLKVVKDYKFRISYDNGANETLLPKVAPSLDPNIPMFLNFLIKDGLVMQVNLSKVRNITVEITERTEANLIL